MNRTDLNACLPRQANPLRDRCGVSPPRMQQDVVWGGAVERQHMLAAPDLDDPTLIPQHPITGALIRPREIPIRYMGTVRLGHTLVMTWSAGPRTTKHP